MANRSKYSRQLVERICECVAKGMPREVAAARAGITRMTLYRWEKDRPDLAEALMNAVEQAEALAIEHGLEQIETAAQNGDWQAAAWRLERRFPQYFAKREKLSHEVSAPDGSPIGVRFIDAQATLARLASG